MGGEVRKGGWEPLGLGLGRADACRWVGGSVCGPPRPIRVGASGAQGTRAQPGVVHTEGPTALQRAHQSSKHCLLAALPPQRAQRCKKKNTAYLTLPGAAGDDAEEALLAPRLAPPAAAAQQRSVRRRCVNCCSPAPSHANTPAAWPTHARMHAHAKKSA